MITHRAVFICYAVNASGFKVNDRPVQITNPDAAISAGIGMVHQHFMLVDNFTVLENVMLGAEGAPLLSAGITKAREQLKALEKEYALDVDPDAVVGDRG